MRGKEKDYCTLTLPNDHFTLALCRCGVVIGSRSSVWDEFWARNCKSLSSVIQVGHHGCPGQVHGMVGEEGRRTLLKLCVVEKLEACLK